jgi:glucose/arabinose dehydrogenase
MLGDTIVARYIVSADDPNEADPNSAQPVLRIDQPYSNHNGGHIVFGLDGYLYIGMGDGGSAGDPQGYSQNGQSLLGKLLRLDVSGQAFDQAYVTIPHDNPYIHNSSLAPQVWVLGLRNPWRFSFDRRTGDLYIGDVGENVWEEINFQPADSLGGENYGWNIMEGQQQQAYSDLPVSNDLVAPIVEYRHNMGCAVTGGYVYRGEALTALQGVYFFSDYCFGTIWSLYRDGNGRWIPDVFMQTHLTVSSFGEDEAGELYVIDHGGTIYQLTSA